MEFCPKCGEKMRAVSIGWLCPKCKCFADTNGDVLVYEDKPFMPKPTNGDLLRSMSDEELAEWMSENCTDSFCDIICNGDCKAINTRQCREIILGYLRQEAET